MNQRNYTIFPSLRQYLIVVMLDQKIFTLFSISEKLERERERKAEAPIYFDGFVGSAV